MVMIWAIIIIFSADFIDISKSFASHLKLLSHANVLSTTHRSYCYYDKIASAELSNRIDFVLMSFPLTNAVRGLCAK
jgi:hypothetical protein